MALCQNKSFTILAKSDANFDYCVNWKMNIVLISATHRDIGEQNLLQMNELSQPWI